MKVLLVGQGGREHALAWKLRQSARVKELFCAPGNPGIARIAKLVPIEPNEIEKLLAFALDQKIDLTVIGPEAPLVAGIVDRFRASGLQIFGPDAFASRLEGSKAFAKAMMKKTGVPTAEYREFTDFGEARAYAERLGGPAVVKADGLAAGKGVTVAANPAAAVAALREAMVDRVFGEAGARVVVEEFLEGEEASLIAICDGREAKLLSSSQDHKRLLDADQGPNTGGMGAYAPAGVVTPQIEREVIEKVFEPVLKELAALGHPFVGFLYAGIMVTNRGIKVLEFNVRLGDPETQVILPRLEGDLVSILLAALDGNFLAMPVTQKNLSAVTVVLAAEGYPGAPAKGDRIEGIEAAEAEGAWVFEAGTKLQGAERVTAGGRVLSVTAEGSDLKEAAERAYRGVDRIHFRGRQYRKDIGYRQLQSAVKR